jgi:hypothetical protein
MRKPVHPIREMREAIVDAKIADEVYVIARHVKPLLDALEDAAFFQPPKQREASHKLLAAWKAKL